MIFEFKWSVVTGGCWLQDVCSISFERCCVVKLFIGI